jgi:hypothetical protein
MASLDIPGLAGQYLFVELLGLSQAGGSVVLEGEIEGLPGDGVGHSVAVCSGRDDQVIGLRYYEPRAFVTSVFVWLSRQ